MKRPKKHIGNKSTTKLTQFCPTFKKENWKFNNKIRSLRWITETMTKEIKAEINDNFHIPKVVILANLEQREKKKQCMLSTSTNLWCMTYILPSEPSCFFSTGLKNIAVRYYIFFFFFFCYILNEWFISPSCLTTFIPIHHYCILFFSHNATV